MYLSQSIWTCVCAALFAFALLSPLARLGPCSISTAHVSAHPYSAFSMCELYEANFDSVERSAAETGHWSCSVQTG